MSAPLFNRRVPRAATVAVMVVIAGLLAWYVLRGQQHKLVTDPAAYGPSLTYFKQVSEFAPPVIPPGAEDVRFRFEWRYFMLGPTRLKLDATFTLPPGEARDWLEQARARLPEAERALASEDQSKVRVVVGDESLLVVADGTSGRVEVHVATPPTSIRR